jgi:hypothetical protein
VTVKLLPITHSTADICYLSAELFSRIDAFLKRSYKYSVASTVLIVSELKGNASHAMLVKMQKTGHYLNNTLRNGDELNVHFRPHGHCFQLPVCFHKLFKKSFLNRCLFNHK